MDQQLLLSEGLIYLFQFRLLPREERMGAINHCSSSEKPSLNSQVAWFDRDNQYTGTALSSEQLLSPKIALSKLLWLIICSVYSIDSNCGPVMLGVQTVSEN